MSSGKTNITSTQFAAKKLLGKAHTSNLKADINETIPSNVSLPSEGVFGEAIPNVPGDQFYTLYSASAGGPATVERVYFDVVSLSDTIYDANVSGGGGDEASTSGAHGYYLKLASNYETTSSNPLTGSGNFTNSKRVYDSRGGLQLIPPLVSNGTSSATMVNPYILKLYKGTVSDVNEITFADNIDWQVDYYSGVVFIQDYNSSKVPVSASAYIYVGKYLDEKISDISSSAAPLTVKEEGSNLTTNASSLNFVGAFVTASTSGNNVTVTIDASAGGSSLTIKDEGSNLTTAATSIDFVGTSVTATTDGHDVSVSIGGAIDYSRTAVTTHTTSSVTDRILGVNATASLEIRLPGASGFSSGQYFVIKDEAGNADSHNITIRASGSETIDGQSHIVLESPYAAVNVYCNGTNKFFVY